MSKLERLLDLEERVKKLESSSDVDGDEVEYIRADMHEARIKELECEISHLEEMRPFWAKGYSSDSMAAQSATGALSSIWSYLGVQDQTACMDALEELKKMRDLTQARIDEMEEALLDMVGLFSADGMLLKGTFLSAALKQARAALKGRNK